MRGVVGAALLVAAPAAAGAQSAHLSAIESSAPASIIEPAAGIVGSGLGGLWTDPTSAPGATGVFFDVYDATFASVQLYHAVVAARLGPRWTFTFASTEIKDLFDTSLTNQDPTLANLRARAWWLGTDATAGSQRVQGSLGLAVAGDDNVGDYHNSTVARAHVRVLPFGERFSAGVHLERVIGGSLPGVSSGRESMDLRVLIGSGTLRGSVTAAAAGGKLWRYSESEGSFGAAVRATVADRLDLGLGIGRYRTSFGAQSVAWQRSAAAGLHLGQLEMNLRYTSTAMGLGSGYAVAISYRPGAR